MPIAFSEKKWILHPEYKQSSQGNLHQQKQNRDHTVIIDQFLNYLTTSSEEIV
jgi:hypothetical protein